MKADIAEKWVAALCSGEIEQTTTALGRVDGTRCCLGVLCDIAVEDEVIPAPIVGASDFSALLHYGSQKDHDNDGLSGGYLPTVVQEWAGMKTQAGHIDTKDGTHGPRMLAFGESQYMSLADANDSDQISFDQIADAIVIYKELL